MPLVNAASVNCDYQIGLVHSGGVKHFSAFIPDDEGGSIAAVFTELRPVEKVTKNGLLVMASVVVPNGYVPKKFDKSPVKIHLCSKKGQCRAKGNVAMHLSEWAYLAEGEEGEGGPLFAVLAAAKQAAAIPPPPPGLQPPQKFEIRTPKTTEQTRPAAAAGPLAAWADAHGVPEVLDLLVACGFRGVEELAPLAVLDGGVEALFASADAEFPIATKCRFVLALRPLRALLTDPPIATPRAGASMHASAAPHAGANPNAGAGPSAAFQHEYTHETAPGFGPAGPLEELAAQARMLLSQVGGPQAAVDLAGPAVQSPPAMAPPPRGAAAAPSTRPPATRSAQSAHPDGYARTVGGRLLSEAGSRPPARPVPLRVMSRQAGAIEEEWTEAGSRTFVTAVKTAEWKKRESLDAAFPLARMLDVAMAAGQVLAEEAWAEVTLRELAALWYADQHPKDQETANFMRESSRALTGIPRGLWLEGREYRKLARGVPSDST